MIYFKRLTQQFSWFIITVIQSELIQFKVISVIIDLGVSFYANHDGNDSNFVPYPGIERVNLIRKREIQWTEYCIT